MKLNLEIAAVNDVPVVADLLNRAARALTTQYGKGNWSYEVTENGIRKSILAKSKVLIAKHNDDIAGTLRLSPQKPWAIDPAYFSRVLQPLYLVDMAVDPAMQRRGVGEWLINEAKQMMPAWPAQAIRLDAYDHAAGAGDFYRKCGFVEKGRVAYRGTPLIYFEWKL